MYQQQLELELENTRRRRTDLELTNKKEDGELVGSICKGPDLRPVCAIRQCPPQFIPCAFFFLTPLSLTSPIPLGQRPLRFYISVAHRAPMERKKERKRLYQTGEMMRGVSESKMIEMALCVSVIV